MPAQWFTELTYGDLVDQAADRFADSIGLAFDGREWTFAQLRDEVNRAAKGLMALGVEKGDVVGIWLTNRPEWYFASFGAAKIGATVLPINTGLRADDLRYVVEHSGCSTLILATRTGPVSYLDVAAGIWLTGDTIASNGPKIVVVGDDAPPDGCISWMAGLAGADAVDAAELVQRAAGVSPADIVSVMYTSGTTGAPKGVLHSHHAIRNVTDEANRLAVRRTDIISMFLPLFHAYGFYEGPLLSLITGAKCVLLDRFDARVVLRSMEENRVTLVFGFTTHFQDLIDHPDFASTDLLSLRAGILAVGPASMERIARRVQRELPGKIVSGYGMTEIGVSATLGLLDEDEDHSAATSGYPLPGYEFRVVDYETRAICPVGVPGEVLIRSYQVTEGFLGDAAKTAETIDADGWLRSGDLGVVLPDGYVRILGRYKDMLRVGGENVDPAEVEVLYGEHPAIREVVFVGVPDERLHEVGCLCVRTADGLALVDVADELLHFADGRLASFKRPRYVLEFQSLPMTASGKVQRHLIQSDAVGRLGLDQLDSID